MSYSKGTQTTEHAALATKGMPSTMDKWAKGLKQIPEHWWMNTSDIQSFIVFEGRLLDDLDDFPIISKHPPLIYDVFELEAPDGSDIVERRLSASAARRLRRKRAAERSRGAAGGVGAANAANGANAMSIDELRAELRRDPNSGIQCLKGQVWRLSRDANGCRVVQEALELGSRDVTDLANELQGHVLEAVMCPYANYVVQKVVSHLSVAASSFVATELQGNAVRAAKHRFACRIFCRLLEFCGRGPTSQLVDELLARDDGEHENLCSHSFAHHVIQSILEHGEERHKKLIAKMLLSDLWRYATHKNSSYLIEKALCYCSTEDQNLMIAKLGHPQAWESLSLDFARARCNQI